MFYVKAITMAHPDKHGNSDGDTKYIAGRVFNALNEAFNEFRVKNQYNF